MTETTPPRADDRVYAVIGECIAKVNADLAREPALALSQVHRFLILHKELDADDGELTRTRKVRRRFIGERYETLIEALYNDRDSAHIESEVIFEDGRKGMLKADLKISAAKTVPVAAVAPTLRNASC